MAILMTIKVLKRKPLTIIQRKSKSRDGWMMSKDLSDRQEMRSVLFGDRQPRGGNEEWRA